MMRGPGVADVDAILDSAGLTNAEVHEYVRYWAQVTGPDSIEVVSVADDARLVRKRWTRARSYRRARGCTTRAATTRTPRAPKSARSWPPATRADKGVTTSWRPAAEMTATLTELDARRVGGQDHVRDPLP